MPIHTFGDSHCHDGWMNIENIHLEPDDDEWSDKYVHSNGYLHPTRSVCIFAVETI